ncbi:YtxH domain-containing protein [Tenuibacillus multivorans]|uniref:Gas vesicle protein n=1 Tax=Tenuibacillus multivorans TaxID=237069 RepID=A0A1H0EES9_9BACI|nr:YtxH domain-containing protein [Tenuibacillus multivorans]GEL77188.1 general stress protein [Tenuibacillus multivorans]SDN80863.1 Gas vesicle protein [Tenuibacillus multivorans]
MANEKESQESINSKDFLIGSLIGGIVGASVALLFAPKSGRELREDLNTGAQQVRDRASEWRDVAYEKGSEWSSQLQEKSREFSDRVKDTKDQVQDRVNQFRDERMNGDNKEALEVAEAIEEAADELERIEANESFEQSVKNN